MLVKVRLTVTVRGLLDALPVMVIVPVWVPAERPVVLIDTVTGSEPPAAKESEVFDRIIQVWLAVAAQVRVPPPEFEIERVWESKVESAGPLKFKVPELIPMLGGSGPVRMRLTVTVRGLLDALPTIVIVPVWVPAERLVGLVVLTEMVTGSEFPAPNPGRLEGFDRLIQVWLAVAAQVRVPPPEFEIERVWGSKVEPVGPLKFKVPELIPILGELGGGAPPVKVRLTVTDLDVAPGAVIVIVPL